MQPLGFQIGPTVFCTPVVLMYEDAELIGYRPPQADGAPWRLNATMLDRNGSEVLRIVGNEWVAGINRYDITAEGSDLLSTSR